MTLIMNLERIILKVDEMQAAVEAILFASGEPIEYERIAEALEIEPEYAENLLMNLGADLDERGSGICLVRMDNQFQLCKIKFARNQMILVLSFTNAFNIHAEILKKFDFCRNGLTMRTDAIFIF